MVRARFMSTLTINDMRKLAELARLRLGEAELALYTTQAQSILDFVADLQTVDVSSVAHLSDDTAVCTPLRADAARPSPLADAIIENAPAHAGRFFCVPKVIG